MARKRMIDPDFWTDAALGALNPVSRLLFMGLISQADDEGRLRGAAALIRSQVFPYDDDITREDVEGWLRGLEDMRLITRYAIDGQTFIHVRNFKKHQTINKPTPSRLPPPPDETSETPLPDDYGSPAVALPSNRREEKVIEEKGSEAHVRALPPASVSETAEVLGQASWINDDLSDIEAAVVRAFRLVPAFDTRDGPLEAEKFARHHTKKPPADWYKAFLNWLKKAVEIQQEREASRPKRKEDSTELATIGGMVGHVYR